MKIILSIFILAFSVSVFAEQGEEITVKAYKLQLSRSGIAPKQSNDWEGEFSGMLDAREDAYRQLLMACRDVSGILSGKSVTYEKRKCSDTACTTRATGICLQVEDYSIRVDE